MRLRIQSDSQSGSHRGTEILVITLCLSVSVTNLRRGVPMIQGALEGVRVLDFSGDIAGSFCARLLADYGAEVLKVEPPGGADLRRMGPFFKDDPHPEKSLLFFTLNLNKRGVTLDIEQESGRNILRRLVGQADVVVETFKPGYLSSLGLGYGHLEGLNPGVVLTSITPFGQTGPYSRYEGEEIVSYAMGAIMSISGYPGPGAPEARGVPGPVRGRTQRRGGHLHGPAGAAALGRGSALGRLHHRVRQLDHDSQPDSVCFHRGHPGPKAPSRRRLRAPYALP